MAWTERSGVKAERVVASNFTYGEAEMAWTERSEVKVEGGDVKMRHLSPLKSLEEYVSRSWAEIISPILGLLAHRAARDHQFELQIPSLGALHSAGVDHETFSEAPLDVASLSAPEFQDESPTP